MKSLTEYLTFKTKLKKQFDNITSDVYGSQVLDTSDLSSFKAFADLTASDVQGWVEAVMGEDAVADLESNLDSQIEELENPTTETITLGE